MLSNGQCPECRKILSDGRNRCACGWFVISQAKSESESPYLCQHIEGGIRCKNYGTSSNRIKGNYWLCREHSNPWK